MAHGGLAQAGKVKRTTPKVEKTERTTRRKCGRARKRAQYNQFIERQESKGRAVGPNKQTPGTK
jgi:ribosomal protein S30